MNVFRAPPHPSQDVCAFCPDSSLGHHHGPARCSADTARAPETKITPEMIEAGVQAYFEMAIWGWDNPGNDELRLMLSRTYEAMATAAPKPWFSY
jgi:hypothetical protein